MKFSLVVSPVVAVNLLVAPFAQAADPVPMDVKLGQWETTATSQNQGNPMALMPPEQLARLTPEQRARIEAALKQAAAPRTTTFKSCLKKDDLTKLPFNNKDGCKTSLVTSTRTKQEIQMECTEGGGKQSGTLTYEALNSENLKFSVHGTATDSSKGANFTIASSGTSKWVGPVCSDSK